MIKSYKYQDDDINRFSSLPQGALFLEPGLGKSRITIKICEAKPDIKTVFIFVPKSLINTWASIEIPKHSELPYTVLPWFHGEPSKSYLREFARIVKEDKRLYVILNHDAVLTIRFDQIFNGILAMRKGKHSIIIDESTVIKSPKAKITKKFIKLGKTAAFRLILSGTPVTNSPLDVYTQAEFLAPNLLGSSNYYAFKTRFAVLKRLTLGNRSFDQIVGYRDLDELRTRLNRFASIRKLADEVDLPPQVFKEIAVDLTEEQYNAYNELHAQAVTYIKQQHEITTVNALSLLNRLQQIVAGQMKLPDGKYVTIDSRRVDALKEQVEENAPKKIIIWSNFKQTANTITKTLAGNIVAVPSALSPLERHKAIERWRIGKEQCLLLNPQSAAHGLTLNEAQLQIWFDRTYSLETRLQALARNYRIGQGARTLVIDLITPGTIEEKVLKRLKEMKVTSDAVVTKADLLDIFEVTQEMAHD
jgi:SNF2 family DNA or RNA helicase